MVKNQVSEIRIEGNEENNTNLTLAMLRGMIEALADMDTTATYAHAKPARHTTATPIKTVKKGTLNAEYIRTWGTDAQQALPLEYLETPEAQTLDVDYMRQKYLEAKSDKSRTFWTNVGRFANKLNEITTKQGLLDVELPLDDFLADYCRKLINQRMTQLPGEHQLICNPDFSKLEGMEAVSQHLGETIQPKPYKVTGQKGRFLSGAEGLTTLEKQIYNEAQTTAQGEPVIEHEDRSKRPFYCYAGGIKKKFSCTTEEAEKIFHAWKIIGIDAKTATEFKKWIEGTSISQAVDYFGRLAEDLKAVEGNPENVIEHYNESEESEETTDCTTWHKLDDARDFAPTWEEKQPAIFQNGLKTIRETKDLATLKTLGVKLFKLKKGTLTKTQTTVIWDEYKRAKHRLEPKLRPLALKALERMTDKKVNLSKVAAWLHGEGKQRLNTHEISVVWDAWKKCRKAYAPKQTLMNDWQLAEKEAAWRLEENTRMSRMTEAELNGTFEQYEDMLFTLPD